METIQYHISLATQSLVVQGRPTGSQSNVKSASLNANSLNYFLLLPSCNYFYNEKLSFFLRLQMEKGKICFTMESYLEAVAFYISIQTYPPVHQNVIQPVIVFKKTVQ